MGGCLSSPATTRHRNNKNGVLKKSSGAIRKMKIPIRCGRKKHKGGYATPCASGPPSISGSAEEVWFEPVSLFGSDSDEDEYETVAGDTVSLNGGDDPSLYKFPSPKNAQKKEENVYPVSVSEDVHKSETIGKAKTQVFANEKRSLSTSSSINSWKNYPSMSMEAHSNDTLTYLRMHQKKPIAGSQVPICPLGKEMFDSWSPIDPSTFRVRGMNYLRDKKKEHASNKAAYYPFGVDIYLSRRKINHIARLVELPSVNSNLKLPPLLVVNVQIPLYPPALFQNENDGEGMNVVMYFKLSENFEKELPLHFQESIRRLIDNEVEKIKGFHKDTLVPFRERLKILSRVANVDVLQLNAPQRKLMHAYNEKPILSRPQHEFFSGEKYLEIDIDMHRFNYISRKGFDAFQDELKICILDVGLTIQGNKQEELPEQVLCCLRVNGIDHTNYHQLEPYEDTL